MPPPQITAAGEAADYEQQQHGDNREHAYDTTTRPPRTAFAGRTRGLRVMEINDDAIWFHLFAVRPLNTTIQFALPEPQTQFVTHGHRIGGPHHAPFGIVRDCIA